MEEPHAITPRAKPLRLLNQCEMTANVGPKITPDDNYT